MEPLTEALRLRRRQTDSEDGLCRHGDIRGIEGRELHQSKHGRQTYAAAVGGILGCAGRRRRPVDAVARGDRRDQPANETSRQSVASCSRAANLRRATRTVTYGLSTLMIAVGAAQIAVADESMRCGNWIVEAPISAEELLSKCGAPLKKEVTDEDVRATGRSGGSRVVGKTIVERWTYKPDSPSLAMIATVVDGKVTRIARDQ
jgi:hypothetical protein